MVQGHCLLQIRCFGWEVLAVTSESVAYVGGYSIGPQERVPHVWFRPIQFGQRSTGQLQIPVGHPEDIASLFSSAGPIELCAFEGIVQEPSVFEKCNEAVTQAVDSHEWWTSVQAFCLGESWMNYREASRGVSKSIFGVSPSLKYVPYLVLRVAWSNSPETRSGRDLRRYPPRKFRNPLWGEALRNGTRPQPCAVTWVKGIS